jgi:hypothetical protein
VRLDSTRPSPSACWIVTVGRCRRPWDPQPTSQCPRTSTSAPSRRSAIPPSRSARTGLFVHGSARRLPCCSAAADAPSRCRSISATSNTGSEDERPTRSCGGPTRRIAHMRATPAGHHHQAQQHRGGVGLHRLSGRRRRSGEGIQLSQRTAGGESCRKSRHQRKAPRGSIKYRSCLVGIYLPMRGLNDPSQSGRGNRLLEQHLDPGASSIAHGRNVGARANESHLVATWLRPQPAGELQTAHAR